MSTPLISEELTIECKNVSVLGSTTSYLDEGEGDTVVFLYGNPTAAYLWRNVTPYISTTHRAVAPDLIGIGHSGKPKFAYTFTDHALYLEGFMEGNMFVGSILLMMIKRPLGEAVTTENGAPYTTVESRLPTWMWPREVPIGGQPLPNVQLMEEIGAFMGDTDMPILLAYADPGVLILPQAVPFYVGLVDDLETAFVGQGFHFIQEDQPDAIGRAIADWLRRN